jgi:hypothetical protein
VVEERDAKAIRAEIEQARDHLAVTVDEIADRVAPSRLVDDVKQAVLKQLRSPAGMAVVSGTVLLFTWIVVRNLRHSRR